MQRSPVRSEPDFPDNFSPDETVNSQSRLIYDGMFQQVCCQKNNQGRKSVTEETLNEAGMQPEGRGGYLVPGLRNEQVLPLVQPQYGSLEAMQFLEGQNQEMDSETQEGSV